MEYIRIKYLDSESNCCYLTEEQNELYCNGDKDKSITVKFGSLSFRLKKIVVKFGALSFKLKKITDDETNSNKIFLSQDLKSQIYIPENVSLQIRKVQRNEIEIGPLVGVFINSKKIAALCEGKDDSVYRTFKLAIRKLRGICCFFSIGDIDWERKLVRGIVRNNSEWVTTILPLPTVIYDRCFGNYGRNHGMEFRKKLGNNYRVINSVPKLAKWETICALKKNPRLLHALPSTIIYNSWKDLDYALRQESSVYLKPDALYKGKGIFRVSEESDGTYKVEHRTDTENEVTVLDRLSDIDKMINSYAALGGGYLIQEEIRKAHYNGYPFDFRLLFQKDWQGKWQPSGIAVRMGAPGSIITSPRSGGAVAEFSKVLKGAFDEDITDKNGLYENVIAVGREVVNTIDIEFGDCVELGLDMTIDVNKRIWIIEVNGKPLKVSLKWLNDPVLMTRCNSRPIEYAVFLTGFQSADTEAGEI